MNTALAPPALEYWHNALMNTHCYQFDAFELEIAFDYIKGDREMSLTGLINDYNSAYPCGAATSTKRGKELYKAVSDKLASLCRVLMCDLSHMPTKGETLWAGFAFRGLEFGFEGFTVSGIRRQIRLDNTVSIRISFEDYFANGCNFAKKAAASQKARKTKQKDNKQHH